MKGNIWTIRKPCSLTFDNDVLNLNTILNFDLQIKEIKKQT